DAASERAPCTQASWPLAVPRQTFARAVSLPKWSQPDFLSAIFSADPLTAAGRRAHSSLARRKASAQTAPRPGNRRRRRSKGKDAAGASVCPWDRRKQKALPRLVGTPCGSYHRSNAKIRNQILEKQANRHSSRARRSRAKIFWRFDVARQQGWSSR